MIKSSLASLFYKFGFEIHNLKSRAEIKPDGFYGETLPAKKIIDLGKLADLANFIPGMTDQYEGTLLFTLAVTQVTSGDIVDIGSWQGKSSSYLARASQVSGNGDFYAIDHFKGNVGSESAYIVNRTDLGDLERGFLQNMSKLGLAGNVVLKNMDVSSAAQELHDIQIRFLFIDGDHSYDGVTRDYSLFKDRLCQDAIVVFDDFTLSREGSVRAINEFMDKTKPSVSFQLGKMLVLVLG